MVRKSAVKLHLVEVGAKGIDLDEDFRHVKILGSGKDLVGRKEQLSPFFAHEGHILSFAVSIPAGGDKLSSPSSLN